MLRTSDLTSWTCSSRPFICARALSSAGLICAPMHSRALIAIKKNLRVCNAVRVAINCSPSTRWRDAQTHRRSPVEGLDYGGPAVVEPRLVRPETLRRHLSVGLPFANPKALSPKALSDVYIRRAYISNTRKPAIACDFTFRIASAAIQRFGRRNREAPHEPSCPGVLEITLVSLRTAAQVVTTAGRAARSRPVSPRAHGPVDRHY